MSASARRKYISIRNQKAKDAKDGLGQFAGRRKQDGRPGSSQVVDISACDSIECKMCKIVSKNEDDQLLQCERCEKWECLTCTGLSDNDYKFLDSCSSTTATGIVKHSMNRQLVQSRLVILLRKDAKYIVNS